jgi:ribosomal protein S18 acetylase RimI-like enzyme
VPSIQSIRIERAHDADVPALIDLLAELFAIESDFSADGTKQRRGLAMLLSQPENRAVVMVARSAGRVVGMASAQLVISTAEGAASAWIEDVVVRRNLRGQGIARLLLRELLAWARRQGATRAQLLADNANQPALDFYRHIGWMPTQLSAWRCSLQDL